MTDNDKAGTAPESESFSPLSDSRELFRRWWRIAVVAGVDQQAVIDKVREDSDFTPHYAFMSSMSAGIAILGLLLSSPAVVIGAMLLSPLMGPILGAGFALAIGDADWLRKSGRAILLGSIIGILFAALVVLLSPLQTVTSEIAARTRPNLFDLVVALFSALAGSYAMIRGRLGTIVGVAIATALMPPLAVVGFGLATASWSVFGGALLLFFTNLMTIALTATAMARIYGFRSDLSQRQSQLQVAVMVSIFIALAIPLGLSLKQIAWEANVSRVANGYFKDQFGPRARVSHLDTDFTSSPITINATVLTPKIKSDAEAQATRQLSKILGQAFNVKIEQFKVEVGTDAQAAELAAAKAKAKDQAVEIEISRLRESLALIAGVRVNDVTLDTSKRRALVIAKPLPGATLATYQALEQRVAENAADWTIMIQPPVMALPDLTIEDGVLATSSNDQLNQISWAAKRLNLPIYLSGGKDDTAAAETALFGQNVSEIHISPLAAAGRKMPNGKVQVRWFMANDSSEDER